MIIIKGDSEYYLAILYILNVIYHVIWLKYVNKEISKWNYNLFIFITNTFCNFF